jgi:hypothetical protein
VATSKEKSLARQAHELQIPAMLEWARQSPRHRELVLAEVERRTEKFRSKFALVLRELGDAAA